MAAMNISILFIKPHLLDKSFSIYAASFAYNLLNWITLILSKNSFIFFNSLGFAPIIISYTLKDVADAFFTTSNIAQNIGRDLRTKIDHTNNRINDEIQGHLDHYVDSGEVSRVRVHRTSDYIFEIQLVYRSITTK